MARIGGKTGNFTIADHKFDAAAFSIDVSQSVDPGAAFINSIWIPHQGAGVLAFGGTVTGFAKDNEASSNVNTDGMTAAGSAATFTLNASTTYAGDMVAAAIGINIARVRGMTDVTLRVMNASTVTEAWDETP